MTRSILFCGIFALAACGDNLSPPAPNDGGQDDAGVPPQADGEFAIKFSPLSYTCYGEARPTLEFYTLADVVRQENPWKFDLLSTKELKGSFAQYDRSNLPLAADGYFKDDRTDNVSLAGLPLIAKRFLEGSVNPDGTFNAFHSFDLGWNLADGTYYSACVYEADINGTRRYMPWDNITPRQNIDGQWRVKKTVIESPLDYPPNLRVDTGSTPTKISSYGFSPNKKRNESVSFLSRGKTDRAAKYLAPQVMSAVIEGWKLGKLNKKNIKTWQLESDKLQLGQKLAGETNGDNLPYTHFVTMDTLTQSANGDSFSISGTYNPLDGYVDRDPITGKVDVHIILEYAITTSDPIQTIVYETKLWGTLLPDMMHLEFSWEWSIKETGEVQWFQHELYEGVPRYQEHDVSLPEPPAGAYNAEYSLVSNDCAYPLYTEHRLLDIWPTDDGGIWPHITNLNIEPIVYLGSDNKLAMSFYRPMSDGTSYTYTVGTIYDDDGTTHDSTITGHTADLNMTIDVAYADGTHKCTALYKITGQKRYESYR